MSWAYLLVAGAFEVATTTMYRYTDGLSRLGPTAAFFALDFVSFFFLNRALATIPIGTAYAVWTGIGAVGTVILGIVLFGEAATLARLACVALIVVGIVGLRMVTD